MATVTVHSYLVWDHQRGRSATAPMKATLERIRMVGGKVLPGTAEQVDVAALDARSRYAPKAAARASGRAP
jgi:hypothetical protein